MKIHVNRVPSEGVQDHATYDPTAMEMDRDDIHLREPFEVDAFMTKIDEALVVTAQIRCPTQSTCARCLEEFSSMIRTRAIFTYTVQPTDVVDITDDVRQEIILAYPMVPICSPGCKGLCTVCGHNLNQGACSHEETAGRS